MVYLLKMVIFHGKLLNNQRVSCAAFDTAIEVCSASLVPSDRQDLVTCGRNGDSHVDGGCNMTGWFELGNGQQWLEDSFLFEYFSTGVCMKSGWFDGVSIPG